MTEVTFKGLDEIHNGWILVGEDTASCDCGHVIQVPDFMKDLRPDDVIDDLHLTHKEDERQHWLTAHGYGSIDSRWATCVYCGCIVGWIDEHRMVCP